MQSIHSLSINQSSFRPMVSWVTSIWLILSSSLMRYCPLGPFRSRFATRHDQWPSSSSSRPIACRLAAVVYPSSIWFDLTHLTHCQVESLSKASFPSKSRCTGLWEACNSWTCHVNDSSTRGYCLHKPILEQIPRVFTNQYDSSSTSLALETWTRQE